MLIRNVEIPGFVGGGPGCVDVRLGLQVEAIGVLEPLPGEQVIEGRGDALLPGLHDHHIHQHHHQQHDHHIHQQHHHHSHIHQQHHRHHPHPHHH